MSGGAVDPGKRPGVGATVPAWEKAASTSFAFTEEHAAYAQKVLKKYPAGRQASAVKDLLRLAQKQNKGWLSTAAIEHVAQYLGMPYIRAYEVATFYDMFNTEPVGEVQIRVCTTTPCMLCGSDDIVRAAQDALGVKCGESTPDMRFYLREFECLGACANAPLMWIDDDYYEDLDYGSAKAIIEALMRGEKPKPGSAKGRIGSMPQGGKTTLHDVPSKKTDTGVSGHGPVEPDPGQPRGADTSGGGSARNDGSAASGGGDATNR